MSAQFIDNEEQVMLRDSVRRWAASRDVREAEDSTAVWAYGAGQGWLMAGLPESAGGLGGSARDSGIIAEELGRGLVRSAFVECGMVGAHLINGISPERAEQIALGEASIMLAHDEPRMRGHYDRILTRAAPDGEGWVLTGQKSGLIGKADSFVVSAKTEDGTVALFEIASADAPVHWHRTIDDRVGGELSLDRTPAHILIAGEDAEKALAAAIDRTLVLESAEALGAMQGSFDLTRDYLMQRKQYGQLIGEFQALRHRLADMFIEMEQARSMLPVGLAAIDGTTGTMRAKAVAATRARVAQAGLYVGGQAIQLHGGIGVTDEYAVSHFYKRLVAFASRHGGEARQVERFAELSVTAA